MRQRAKYQRLTTVRDSVDQSLPDSPVQEYPANYGTLQSLTLRNLKSLSMEFHAIVEHLNNTEEFAHKRVLIQNAIKLLAVANDLVLSCVR